MAAAVVSGLAGLAGLALLAGCETHYVGEPPLREATTPREKLWLHCVGTDPGFITYECRQFAGPDR
ncbi:hypothetical protein H0I76_16550 [Limibaculum sp. M0105]|uniref:Lipoprotein n=1 Tax=Thermohalobaculum xanthum TaxID=2753746 RepID=A0A8J7SHK2_9RHOB|nr:hypothetical protein [Thermohalobaculum xanthum]MBK0400812.1 hypothetical protein [Thermohalobaculum xanthum]